MSRQPQCRCQRVLRHHELLSQPLQQGNGRNTGGEHTLGSTDAQYRTPATTSHQMCLPPLQGCRECCEWARSLVSAVAELQLALAQVRGSLQEASPWATSEDHAGTQRRQNPTAAAPVGEAALLDGPGIDVEDAAGSCVAVALVLARNWETQ